MAQKIISQRFAYPLSLPSDAVFAAAGGVVHHTQPNGGAGAPPVMECKTFPATENDINGTYFPSYRDTLNFADSIFVKRWRIVPEFAAPFYGMKFTTGSDYVSFLWFHSTAIAEGRDVDETARLFSRVPGAQVGEWRDVNEFIPRPSNLDGLPDLLGQYYYLGAFLPSLDLYYSAVPDALAGQGIAAFLEVEIAHTISRFVNA